MNKNTASITLIVIGVLIIIQPMIWFVVYRLMYNWGKIADGGLSLACCGGCLFAVILLLVAGVAIMEGKDSKSLNN